MGETFDKEFIPQCKHLEWLTEYLDGWQFGEQGLVKALAQRLMAVDGLCVEYGAGDGHTLPVTIDQIMVYSPERCLLIEIDDDKRIHLSNRYGKAKCWKTFSWHLVRELGYVKVDLVVIDIDGSDSVVMREMFAAGVRPTLLVVEHFDKHFPIGTSNPASIPQWLLGLKLESGHAIQDTAETIHAIAAQNGYERIGWNRCNSFFVVKERFTDLFR